MFAWVNFAVLITATLLFLYFYVLSVGPASMEKVIGPQAYPLCGRYRLAAGVFETITVVNYILYLFYPLPVPLPRAFPWPWWASGLIAVVIAVPSVILMLIGMKDAGREAIAPRKEQTLYTGIYTHMRHPQAVGEVFAWLWIGFLLHSPFLVIFSLAYFPVFLVMCWAEERDLLLRFGDSYAQYMRTTGAFWPKRWGVTANGGQ